jgi:HSP20 family protein
MNLIRYNPSRLFDHLWDRALTDLFPAWPVSRADAETAGWSPRVDVSENESAFQIQADIPGADRDSLKVEVKDGVLSIQGEKRREATSDTDGVYRSERSYGAFLRKFSLPEEVDGERIEAVYKDGVLSVTLPKKPEAAPKRIPVKVDATAEAKQIGAN